MLVRFGYLRVICWVVVLRTFDSLIPGFVTRWCRSLVGCPGCWCTVLIPVTVDHGRYYGRLPHVAAG